MEEWFKFEVYIFHKIGTKLIIHIFFYYTQCFTPTNCDCEFVNINRAFIFVKKDRAVSELRKKEQSNSPIVIVKIWKSYPAEKYLFLQLSPLQRARIIMLVSRDWITSIIFLARKNLRFY